MTQWRGSHIWVWGLLILAFFLRVWNLELKPPHFDEGINGHFVMQIWKTGYHEYDPSNFHGPLYFYLLQLAEVLFGRGIFGFRFVTGLVSMGVVAGILLHEKFFGRAAYWAAGIVALSPGFVFYSRYAIHESLFIFFQVVFSYGYFTWREERSKRSVWLMMVAFFGSFAVKETFFIFFGTWAIAIACVEWTDKFLSTGERRSDRVDRAGRPARSDLAGRRDWAIAGLVGAASLILLFTGFLLHPEGAVNMLKALAIWTKTGVGQTGHEKEFIYWLKLMARYELPVLVALVVSPWVFISLGRQRRLLTLTAFGTWLAYSLIPYKTPWLILNFAWILAFVFGFFIERGVRPRGWQTALRVFGIGAVLWSGAVMLRLNFRDFTLASEPYVYVQSTLEYKRVMDLIERRIELMPEERNMRIIVANRDTWPMPWTLSLMPRASFQGIEQSDLTDAAVVLIDKHSQEPLEKRLKGRFLVLPFQIRDAYEPGFAYLSFERFGALLPSSTPVFNSDDGGR